MAREILLVEDSEPTALLYREYLVKAGYSVRHAATAKLALKLLNDRAPEAVVLDIELPDGDGIEILKEMKAQLPNLLVIMMTANASVDRAVIAMQNGAHDFLQKPFDSARLLTTLRNALAVRDLSREVERLAGQKTGFHDFVGSGPAMQPIYRVIEQVAASRVPVFVTGESGTGKELAARALHQASPRHAKPFRAINCAAIPKDLLESELFGHTRGAFTGATQDRLGAVQSADGGTLFLDEICEMPLELQAKLLRLIQMQVVQPVGSDKETKVDVRFVAATNRNPWDAVESGLFREDLYYRLCVVPVDLPPLRERGADIEELSDHFLRRYAAEDGKQLKGYTPVARHFLAQQSWPGNVRQLENAVRYAVAVAAGTEIDVGDFPPLQDSRPNNGHVAEGIRPLWMVEQETIMAALQETHDDVARAAALLEVAPSTIYRKLQQWKQLFRQGKRA